MMASKTYQAKFRNSKKKNTVKNENKNTVSALILRPSQCVLMPQFFKSKCHSCNKILQSYAKMIKHYVFEFKFAFTKLCENILHLNFFDLVFHQRRDQ